LGGEDADGELDCVVDPADDQDGDRALLAHGLQEQFREVVGVRAGDDGV